MQGKSATTGAVAVRPKATQECSYMQLLSRNQLLTLSFQPNSFWGTVLALLSCSEMLNALLMIAIRHRHVFPCQHALLASSASPYKPLPSNGRIINKCSTLNIISSLLFSLATCIETPAKNLAVLCNRNTMVASRRSECRIESRYSSGHLRNPRFCLSSLG
jgi:hypothetical protein